MIFRKAFVCIAFCRSFCREFAFVLPNSQNFCAQRQATKKIPRIFDIVVPGDYRKNLRAAAACI